MRRFGNLVSSIQLFHTFLCNSQNYHPEVLWMTRNSSSVHPQLRGVIVMTVTQEGLK